MDYPEQEQDLEFVKRTLELLVQYNYFIETLKTEETYEVTLLINSCVGLLIVPQSKWYSKISKAKINQEKWGINPDDISICKHSKKQKDQDKIIPNIVTHLRNSVAHYNFKMLKNENNKIGSIKFEDYQIKFYKDKNGKESRKKGKQTFELEIEIEPLKKFLLKFSEEMIRIMEAAKNG